MLAFIVTLTGRFGLTVIGIVLLVAEGAHGIFDVITTLTTSLLFSVVDMNVSEDVCPPAGSPFTCHWNRGDVPPSLISITVNVTGLPSQIVVVDASIVTEVGLRSFTVMVIALLVVVEGHSASAVTFKVILSAFCRVELV